MGLMSYTILPGLAAEISRVYLVINELNFKKSETILSIIYDRAIGLAGNITTTIFGLVLFLIYLDVLHYFRCNFIFTFYDIYGSFYVFVT